MPDDTEPKLTVQLKLDDAGHPIFVDDTKHRRYNVIMEVENAPSDTYAATFELDPTTSYDAVRTLKPEPDGGFRLETTTYGDYPVVVRLRRSNGEDLILKDGIARGLRRTHAPTGALAPVSEALSYIAEH
jgi:hypothetical protein